MATPPLSIAEETAYNLAGKKHISRFNNLLDRLNAWRTDTQDISEEDWGRACPAFYFISFCSILFLFLFNNLFYFALFV